MSYNQLMDYIQKGTDAEEDPDSLFKFRDIVAHQGPLESTDPDHKGSKYNVMVEWESGEVTYEHLALISKDDPITPWGVQVTIHPIVTIYIRTLLAWAKCFLTTYGEYPGQYDLLDTPRSVLLAAQLHLRDSTFPRPLLP